MPDSPAAPIDNPTDDLAGYITQSFTDGTFEQDPYSFATAIIAATLEMTMGDGINGSMSVLEYEKLDELAGKLVELDPAITISPQVA